jgi:hypothetical protein
MNKQKNIQINPFQLNRLLDENEKEDFQFLLDHGVFCNQCELICENGVEDYTTHLDAHNDIVLRGKCAVCGGKVSRIMEFGEDETFFEKAYNFKEELKE